MNADYSPQHHIFHNELIENGWLISNNMSTSKSYIYKNNKNVYDEFILDYISNYQVAVTVPIPCSTISYRNIFQQKDTKVIQEYLKLHVNNNNRQ
jgi:hypothetical protein